ncbi:MAG: GGDEF domain-containing protein [Erysipelotrichaceae bacterium]|nr:GGDEF domain-containing protein [Erysipelotrichaceae bacterium]
MERIKRIYHLFKYAGLTESEMDICRPEVLKRNANTMNWILLMILALLVILDFFSFVPGSGEEANRQVYLIYTILVSMQYLSYHFYFSKHTEQIYVLAYIFLLTAYSFGMYNAVFMGVHSSSTPLCVLMVLVPLLIIDTPLHMILMIADVTACVLVCMQFVNRYGLGDQFVIVNTLSSAVLGSCSTFSIQRTKYSDIKNHLMLEKQRDTDMLTGARSRNAYIRDLELMGEFTISVGIVYADVNGLKKANDTIGHEAGDILIRNAFQLMMKHFSKSTDRIYRVGGDEFVIICVGEEEETFRARFEEMANHDENSGCISCGCFWQAQLRDSASAIKQAELMMYESKNRYYLSHPTKDRRVQ